MSQDSRALVELIQKLSGTYGNTFVKVFDAVVKSVDEDSRICVVDSLSSDNQIQGLRVRFMLDVSDGDLGVPEVDSTVSVALNDYTEPYIVSSTWLSKKEWVVGDSSFTIEKENIELKQKDFEILISENKMKLKNKEKDLKTILDSFIDAVAQMTFTNGAGVTGVSNNVVAINQIKTDLNQLLK